MIQITGQALGWATSQLVAASEDAWVHDSTPPKGWGGGVNWSSGAGVLSIFKSHRSLICLFLLLSSLSV